jgi:hypothetical protein
MEYQEAVDYINQTTDRLLLRVGGQLTADNMTELTLDEHCLLAYRYLRDEVMEGGFIQMIQNGYGTYVLQGPFPMLLKKEWGLRDFSKFLYEVYHEYKAHKEELEADKSEEEFMAQYEKFDKLNNYGDDYLDDWEETITPAIAETFMERQKNIEEGLEENQ